MVAGWYLERLDGHLSLDVTVSWTGLDNNLMDWVVFKETGRYFDGLNGWIRWYFDWVLQLIGG